MPPVGWVTFLTDVVGHLSPVRSVVLYRAAVSALLSRKTAIEIGVVKGNVYDRGPRIADNSGNAAAMTDRISVGRAS